MDGCLQNLLYAVDGRPCNATNYWITSRVADSLPSKGWGRDGRASRTISTEEPASFVLRTKGLMGWRCPAAEAAGNVCAPAGERPSVASLACSVRQKGGRSVTVTNRVSLLEAVTRGRRNGDQCLQACRAQKNAAGFPSCPDGCAGWSNDCNECNRADRRRIADKNALA